MSVDLVAIAHEADAIEKQLSEDEIASKYFKDYGCINFKSDEFFKTLKLARELHSRACKKSPAAHVVSYEQPYRCYHETICTCGYKEACDSSD